MANIFLAHILLFCTLSTAAAGVLATEDDIDRGRKNLDDPAFSLGEEGGNSLSAAVSYLLTGDQYHGGASKNAVKDALFTAKRRLFESRGFSSDISSQKLYEALLIYDLVSDSELWDAGEREALRKSMKFIIDYYLRSDVIPWYDEVRNTGAATMRVVASCALFALNFPNDTDFRRYLQHSRRFLERNLACSIDDYGAWTADSPGIATAAIEYLIVTAKALKNGKVHDYFSNRRLRKVLMCGMKLTPPQTPSVRGAFMAAGKGQAGPGSRYMCGSVLAVANINAYSPSAASHLLWHWERCGKPSDPLGVLFIDTGIPVKPPDEVSSIVGGGMVVLRHNFGSLDESFVFAGFNGLRGIPDCEARNHSDSGDFSFVWSGIPLTVHSVFSENEFSEYFVNAAAWRHNLVTRRGSGETPVFRELSKYTAPSAPPAESGRIIPADFYPEGINQFLSTIMVDYVSGEVRLKKRDMPATSYHRHFLFLKPDALLIWDQIDSAFPLEWNLWMPVETAGAEENVLHLLTEDGVDIEVLFPGTETIEYSIDKQAESITWDWPLIMRAESGLGSVTVTSLDFVSSAIGDDSAKGREILRNILSQGGENIMTGLIGGARETADVLTRLGTPCELLSDTDLKEESLYNYSTLIIDSNLSKNILRALNENGAAVDKYVKNGGSVVWMCPAPSDWSYGNDDCPVFVPAAMVPSGYLYTPASTDSNLANSIKLYNDRLWQAPRTITLEDFAEWLSGYLTDDASVDTGTVTLKHAIHIPASWSDSWKVLASIKAAIPLKSQSGTSNREPSRIRVYHTASEDFMALLLPRRTGKPYLFDIINRAPGYVSFTDNTNDWEIQTGGSSWTDANLSVRISSVDGIKGIYAFDCNFMTVGDERFVSEKPLSIYYSPLEGAGVIYTSANNVLSTSRVDFKLYAGEVNFYDFNGDVWTERISYITTLFAVDGNGNPAGGMRVYENGRFIGSTCEDGKLVVRWSGRQPEVLTKLGGYEKELTLIPGKMQVSVGE